MQSNKIKVYIAAPFFNEVQINSVSEIEFILSIYNIEHFSPRSTGILRDMNETDRRKKSDYIFKRNIEEMHSCNIIIAVIDDKDIGTIFEIGYFSALKKYDWKKIITFTNENFGLNVMIQKTVDAHIHGISQLRELFFKISMNGIIDNTFDKFLDFNEKELY